MESSYININYTSAQPQYQESNFKSSKQSKILKIIKNILFQGVAGTATMFLLQKTNIFWISSTYGLSGFNPFFGGAFYIVLGITSEIAKKILFQPLKKHVFSKLPTNIKPVVQVISDVGFAALIIGATCAITGTSFAAGTALVSPGLVFIAINSLYILGRAVNQLNRSYPFY